MKTPSISITCAIILLASNLAYSQVQTSADLSYLVDSQQGLIARDQVSVELIRNDCFEITVFPASEWPGSCDVEYPNNECAGGGSCSSCFGVRITNRSGCSLSEINMYSLQCYRFCAVLDQMHYPSWSANRINCQSKGGRVYTPGLNPLADDESLLLKLCATSLPLPITFTSI